MLPADDSEARELVLSKAQYVIVDDMLYRILPGKTLWIIPPTEDRLKLFQEAHGGVWWASQASQSTQYAG